MGENKIWNPKQGEKETLQQVTKGEALDNPQSQE